MAAAAPGSGNDYDWIMKMMGGMGSAAGGMWNKFHPGKNPADTANGYIDQISGQTKPYYQPYMDAGKGALEDLQNQNKGLLGGTTQNDLGASYKESPGYKFALEQALQGSNNAYASGGQLGLPQHMQSNMEQAQGIAAKDYNDYMNRQTDLYKTGYGGTQTINQQGADANKNYADVLGNTLSQKGYYGFSGQEGKNKGNAQNNSDIWSGIGQIGGGILGAPFGPAGSTVGSGLGKWIAGLFGGH